MTRFFTPFAACALLIGCNAPADAPEAEVSDAAASTPASLPGTPSPEPPAPAPAGDADVAAPWLAGEYRIAGVDGGDINLPHGITASIGENRIAVTSQCVELAWSYRFEGTRLVTEAVPVVSCDRGRYPEEEAIQAAFTAARVVERTANNGIRFTGGGRSVTLFSQ